MEDSPFLAANGIRNLVKYAINNNPKPKSHEISYPDPYVFNVHESTGIDLVEPASTDD